MAEAGPAAPAARPRRWGALATIAGVLALVLAAGVWVQGTQLSLVQQAMRSNDGYSVLSLYQVESEYLKLLPVWRDAAAGTGDPDALRLRYEVWVSRVNLLRSPSLQRLMTGSSEYDAIVRQLEAFVRSADTLLGPTVDQPPNAAALAALTPDLRTLGAPTHALTLVAARRVAERTEASNQALQLQSRLGLGLTVSLGLLCAAFAGLAGRQMRRAQQRQASLEVLATRLRDARREAESASAAKSAFLANMSHEIRTPFQGLLGMLSLLRESGLGARQAEHLRVATESADHLLAILNDILDMSRLESGQMTIDRSPVDLRALLRQVEALMRPQAHAKSLALHIDAEPAAPEWILADATRVKQVLFNLLSNAVKFSDRGSISLDVRVQPSPAAHLQFIVTDTGVGMDRETTDRLFRRFTPGDARPSRKHGGAGLGLEISRTLARLMGGDIHVHSVPGEGSRFTFELPLERAERPSGFGRATADAPREQAPSLRVLVAEDHPVNRQYLASVLEMLHHPAHFVANGRDAVKAVQEQPFDLVLMDLHMPELDGIGATVAIRALKDSRAATVPIVALTADAFPETRERCLLAGMNDFLTKPVSPQDLGLALRRFFGHTAADSAPTAHGSPTLSHEPVETRLIDRVALERVREGVTAERLAELIDEFFAEGRRTVERMRTAVRDGQPLELRVHAHAARGAALNLGLTALAQTAQALHEGAAHLPAHEIAHLVQRFDDQLGRTRSAAIEQGWMAKGGSPSASGGADADAGHRPAADTPR